MKASKFSEAQKAFILKQGADGMPVADVCRKAGISQATYFNWEEEIRLAADGDAAGRHPRKNLRPVRQRKLVDAVCVEWDVSIRRACQVLEVERSSYHSDPDRPAWRLGSRRFARPGALRRRRVHVLLRREDWSINQKTIR